MPRNQQLKAGFARDSYSDFSYLWHWVSRRESSLAWIPRVCSVPAGLEREKQAIFILALGCGVHPKLSTTRERDWICCLCPVRPSSSLLSSLYS